MNPCVTQANEGLQEQGDMVVLGHKIQLTEREKWDFQQRYRSKIKDTRPPRKRKAKRPVKSKTE